MRYIVDKPFTYAGREYQRGEVWEPQGYRADALLKSQRRVHEEPTDDAEPTPAEPKPRGRRVPT